MTDATDFQIRFPEFCSVDDDRVQMFLDDAALLMGDKAKWLSYYDVAQAYYAAHLLQLATYTEDGDGSVAGPIKRQEVDDVVIEQAVEAVTASDGELGTTAYGKRFLTYRKICLGAMIVGV